MITGNPGRLDQPGLPVIVLAPWIGKIFAAMVVIMLWVGMNPDLYGQENICRD